ncbi:Hpt domain-containing protein [Hirschia litorea]|uniref:Hpt domain-containing protein n=1 Tax=Hirschia litorea TaxID=1199156 RepID=A0ABW2ILF4_9PROT
MTSNVIDLEHLNAMTGGDAELAREVLGIFRHQSEIWGRLLVADAPNEQWADAAHSIKGAARSIGAMALGDACEVAETRGRAGNVAVAEASVLINAIKDHMIDAVENLAKVEHQLSMSEAFKAS